MLDTPRDTCLQSKQNQHKSARIPFVVPYHPPSPSFHWTTKHHLCTLHASERLQNAFLLTPLIAFQRLRKLRDYLVQMALTCTFQGPLGNWPCGASKCKSCLIFLATDDFSSHTNGQHLKIKVNASFKSSNLIYVITWGRCGQQYICEMEQLLHCRINSHW